MVIVKNIWSVSGDRIVELKAMKKADLMKEIKKRVKIGGLPKKAIESKYKEIYASIKKM